MNFKKSALGLIACFFLCANAFAALRGTAVQANTTGSTTIVVTVSGIGIQLNDTVLIFVNGGGGGGNTFTYPSGFGAISGAANVNVNGSVTLGVACKIATASEPSTYTVTSSANDLLSVNVRVYSGRNPCVFTAAVATASTALTGTSPFSLPLTGLTAAAGDDLVNAAGFDNGGINVCCTYVFGAQSGWANAITAFAGISFGTIIGSSDDVAYAGGATGTITPTLTDSGHDPTFYGGYVLALAAGAAPVSHGVLTSGGHPVVSGTHPVYN